MVAEALQEGERDAIMGCLGGDVLGQGDVPFR